MKEIWKNIKGYEGLYQISNYGNIKSLDRIIIYKNKYSHFHKGKYLKQEIDINGYLYISISKDGKIKKNKVHRLVAETFIFNPKNKSDVNHKDGNKQNNNIDNLEWNTHQENENHAVKNKLKSYGQDHYLTKLTNEQVKLIKWIAKNVKVKYGFWSKLSKKLNINKNIISSIINNKSWKSI